MIITVDTVAATTNDTIVYDPDATETHVIGVENDGGGNLDLVITEPLSGFRITNTPDLSLGSSESTTITVASVLDVPGVWNRTILINDFILNLSLTTTEEYAAYTTRAQMERSFGKQNIKVWADIDGDEDENAIELVVYETIKEATLIIDSMMERGFYNPPFDPVPAIIELLARKKAGCLLYYGRALQVEVFDRLMANQMGWFTEMIDQLNRGKIYLAEESEFNTSTNAPFLV